ncbi:MAG: T9SS type A sorting domain-containing protein, partial [Flavobacteriaceae bacterium]
KGVHILRLNIEKGGFNMNWINFREIDSDSDGVSDSNDNCPDTPQGTRVDVNGCPVFELPLNNFKVEVGSATCIGNTDGVINLSVEDANYDYSVTVTGQSDLSITGTSTTASVTGLAKGTYEVCFNVVGQDGYEQCFEVVVGEPKPLSAFINVDDVSGKMSVTMGGSSTYYVNINGVNTTVDGDSFETELSTGLSIIRISTDLECQGVVEQEVFISEKIHYYPNPTISNVKVHVGGEDEAVKVSVFSEKGDLIYTRDQNIEQGSRKIHIDLTNQITGTYIVTLESKTVRQSFKIIRK